MPGIPARVAIVLACDYIAPFCFMLFYSIFFRAHSKGCSGFICWNMCQLFGIFLPIHQTSASHSRENICHGIELAPRSKGNGREKVSRSTFSMDAKVIENKWLEASNNFSMINWRDLRDSLRMINEKKWEIFRSANTKLHAAVMRGERARGKERKSPLAEYDRNDTRHYK